jgi:hypothetical protein
MTRQSLVCLASLLVGCGSVGELLGIISTDSGSTGTDSPDSSADAATDANIPGEADSPFAAETSEEEDAPYTDATGDAGPTTPGQGPFGPVSRVAAVSNAGWVNEDPSLTGDQLELYFASRQTPPESIWVSRRATVADTWGTPVAVAELGSSANEPCVARDGLTIWFARPGTGDAQLSYKIWVSSRATQADAWAAPQPVNELAAPGFDDEKPSVDDAELVMVFMSNRPGGAGGLDIYMSTRPNTSDPWGTPTNLTELNTTGDERDPFIGGQDLQIFWAANPPMEVIRSATRASVAVRFSVTQPLSELGGPNFDPTLSMDLHHIMFASQRPADQHQQIYEAFR